MLSTHRMTLTSAILAEEERRERDSHRGDAGGTSRRSKRVSTRPGRSSSLHQLIRRLIARTPDQHSPWDRLPTFPMPADMGAGGTNFGSEWWLAAAAAEATSGPGRDMAADAGSYGGVHHDGASQQEAGGAPFEPLPYDINTLLQFFGYNNAES